MEQDRVILLTGGGAAAIAVVRIVGPRVADFLSRHFSRAIAPGRCVNGEIRDGSEVIDDAVAVLSEQGGWADLNVHGGPWVVRRVMDLAAREGFELVDAGLPVTDDAVDAPTLLEREVLAHLPLARTQLAVEALLAQREAWPAVFADIEAGRCPSGTWLNDTLADRALWWLLHPPLAAIIGLPNVGKSTLANQLFAQERSITADLPGTTRDWVGEIANVDGLAVMLVDTPGLRATEDHIERQAIDRSAEQVRRADLVIVVLDATIPLPDQQHLVKAHAGAIITLNKVDRAATPCDVPGAIPTIATTGHGIAELRRCIRSRFGCDSLDLTRPRWWTERQGAILARAVEGKDDVRAALLSLKEAL